jgi:hypothetical protein
MPPRMVAKTANVGMAPASICVVTSIEGGARQAPVAATVWQSASVTGRLAAPCRP